MNEWPLAVFTVAVQLSCGLALGAAFADARGRRMGIMRLAGIAVFPVAVFGLLASSFHLGRPVLALNALRNLGSSRLSAEVLLTLLFTATALAYSNTWRKDRTHHSAALGWVTGAIGLAAVVSSSWIYMLPSRPVWNSGWLPASFVGSTLLLGGLACALLAGGGDRRLLRSFIVAAIAGSIITLAAAMWMLLALGRPAADQYTSVALQSALGRLASPWYWGRLQLSLVLTAIVPIAVAVRLWQEREQSAGSRRFASALAFTAVIAGVLIGRMLVYSLGASIPNFSSRLAQRACWSERVPEMAGQDKLASSQIVPPSRATMPSLVRDLSVSQAVSVVVGTIIGTGIFLVPKEMMEAVGSAKLVNLAWVVGGLLSFFGALTYAELGAMKPEAGGEYVYMRDGYGPLGGFLYAWTTFLIAKPGSIATIAAGIVRILGTFSALSSLNEPLLTLTPRLAITYGHLVGLALILFISGVNYIGVRKAGDFQLFFTVLKVVIVLGVIVVGFSYAQGSWAHFSIKYVGARGGFTGFMVALVAALWAYDGWNNVNMVAGEVRRPERNVPIALIAGVSTCAFVYVLFNAAVQYVMTPATIANSGRPGSDAVLLVLGAGASTAFAGAMALQMLATLNAAIMSGARVPFATARDGYFMRALAEVHPRFHTPSVSLGFQAVLAAIMLLLAGGFQQLFSLTLFAEWLFYMLTASTVFVFRRTEPNVARPYKTWGFPAVPALFIGASAVLLVYTFKADVWNSIIGVAVILVGVPVFYFFSRKRDSAA